MTALAARFVFRCWLAVTVASALGAVWDARELILLVGLAGGLLFALVGYVLWARPSRLTA